MGRTRRKQARAERGRMGSQSVGKRARETAQGQKICRNIDLCKSRGRNLPESGPPRRFRVKNLSECRPVQVAAPESVVISTCATLSVSQVAFSTGFSLPCPPRRSAWAKNCRNVDLCKPFSCTSRVSDRIFSLTHPATARRPRRSRSRATAQAAIPPAIAATATEADIGQKWTLPIVYEASWET